MVLTKEKKIKFVKQYRYAIKDYLIELPAGKIDLGENPDNTIIRELEEEVGIIPNKIEKIGKIVLSPGFSNEFIHMYYVDDYETGNINFDEDEDLDSFDLTIDETLQMIKEGIIYDSKSVALIMLLKDKLISIKK